ncbi:hypothetical protein SDC9_75583 [bioreactor metagenome]|uniref:Uncharacterized protein n=1 Tax=bioreactor metagenome TaxID=1076179 RepID=A0A644YSJ8_9ZZZZ
MSACQRLADIKAPSSELVVAKPDLPVVHPHTDDGVGHDKGENRHRIRECLLRYLEGSLKHPITAADPLNLQFLCSYIGIVDDTAFQ